MSAAAIEASQLLKALAEPHEPGESVKSLIWRASRVAGIPAGVGKNIWYQEKKTVTSDQMDSLRKAVRKREAQIHDAASEIHELDRLTQQLEILAAKASEFARQLDDKTRRARLIQRQAGHAEGEKSSYRNQELGDQDSALD